MSLRRTPASTQCKHPNRLAAVLRAGLHIGARDRDKDEETLASGGVRRRYQLHLAHSATSKANGFPGQTGGALDEVENIKRRNVIDYALVFDAATGQPGFEESEEWSLFSVVLKILQAVYAAGPKVVLRDEDGRIFSAAHRRADRIEQNTYGPRYIQFFFQDAWHVLAARIPCGKQNSAGYQLMRDARAPFELFLIEERDNLRGPRIYYSYSPLSRHPRVNQVNEWPNWIVDGDDSTQD